MHETKNKVHMKNHSLLISINIFLLQAMEMSDFLVKNKLEQIVENFKVR